MRRLIVFLALTSLLLLAIPGAAHEGETHREDEVQVDPPVAVRMQSPGEAAIADAKAVAEASGAPLDAVLRGLAHQDRFDQVLLQVGERYGEIYAGAYTDNFPQSVSTIRIKGQVPAALMELVAASGEPVEIVGGAPHSWQELTTLGREVSLLLQEEGHPGAVTWIEVREGRINATVPFTRRSAAEITGQVLARVVERQPETARLLSTDTLRIEVAAPGTELGVGEHTYGGGEALDDGFRECTTAFTVNLAGGGTGVLTAAHCNGINQYRQNDGLTYSMPWLDEHVGTYGDMEIHSSTHIEPDDYYADFNMLRDVSGISPITAYNVGDWICKFGRTTGRDCSSEIYSLWICYYPDHRQACNLVAVDEHITAGGDSGGPWYWGNTAWGIHSGRASIGGTMRSVWTPTFWVDNEFGATVRQ